MLACLTMPNAAYAAPLGPGWYARGDVGVTVLGPNGTGYWTGPGGGAPRITFGLDDPATFTGSMALGYDWMNGIRSDLSFTLDSNMDVTATIRSTSDGSPTAGHTQTITGSINAQALMANLFVEPLKLTGNDGPVQPFLTVGAGVAHVSMGQWTRYNPNNGPPDTYRTFYGADQFNLAWTAGGGVSVRLGEGRPGMAAPILDLTYRLSSYGNVAGGDTPTRGMGPGPREPFNFDDITQTATVGLRVPIGP